MRLLLDHNEFASAKSRLIPKRRCHSSLQLTLNVEICSKCSVATCIMEQLQRFADTISRISFDDSIYFMGIRRMPKNQEEGNITSPKICSGNIKLASSGNVCVCVWLLQTIKTLLFFSIPHFRFIEAHSRSI